jgi:hypothetical protein
MSKRKKIILSVVLSTAAVVGITTGIVFAEDENDVAQPEARQEALLQRICEIYEDNTGVAIEPEMLKDAFIEAQEEMMAEAMEGRLDKLVEEGVISSEEAQQLKDWLAARPETSLPRRPIFRGGPSGRFGPKLGGFGFPRRQCVPDNATNQTSFTY